MFSVKGTIPYYVLLPAVLIVLLFCGNSIAATITGTVTDSETGEPIPYVTIRVLDTEISISANEEGDYRLKLRPGSYQLKFSHLSYYTVVDTVNLTESDFELDISMQRSRIEVPGIRVSASGLTEGEKIIVAAIERKEEILSRFESYSYEAYVKLVVREEGAEDSTSIAMITESQHECFWESPDKYKEIITAQKRSANLDNAEVLIVVGNPVNFNENRIDIGEPVVSPTADDALDYYEYYLIDTIMVDNRPVFRLEMRPKSESTLLFSGEILIADSTYDVVGIDCEFNEAFNNTYVKDPSFSQRYEVFDDEYWMPVEIRFEADIELPFPGAPRFFADYVAALHEYHLNFKLPDDTFDEYVFEMSEDALDVDSTVWASKQLIPLTEEELGGYRYLDSVANAPKGTGYYILSALGLGLTALNSPAVFHFNRVEGTYLGWGDTFDFIPRTKLYLASGYAFSGDYWQHNYRTIFTLWDRHKLKLNVGYRDKIVNWKTVISSRNENPTIGAALNKTDPFDYYLEEGFDAGFSIRVGKHTTMRLKYLDYLQSSVDKATEYSMLRETKKHRANPDIDDGKLRAFSLNIDYDSRKLMKIRGEESPAYASSYTLFNLGFELSLYDFDSDFDYSKIDAGLYRRQVVGGFGTSEIKLVGGLSSRSQNFEHWTGFRGLPRQRHYVVDFGGLVDNDLAFKTLGEKNFYGDMVLTVYYLHDFGNLPFRLSGLPLIGDLPFSLAVYAGEFWTHLENAAQKYDYPDLHDAEKMYTEAGFQIGRIPPVGLKLNFTWQLSAYDTNDFSVSVGFDLLEF